ncbi:DUF6479 family protein [Streptomyces sp. B-S-A8]|uniref:DUF6479 family protein n=2 Tax=Streptomyces solicavernae TaxID=3043614 RepID=A0ABT6RU08_9ACTN|nr:DUF6479 family protein [Streptomyces sp. B-S-A8]MDI3387914.1 DUF6479 family protein [Streptomyces sp. B-S-A8]
MITATSELFDLAATSGAVGRIAAFVGGIVIVGGLLGAFWLGNRVRDREPHRPLPEEQPKMPESGPVREIREVREADEMPVAKEESERLMPYALHPARSRRSKNQTPPRWTPGMSGSFGSGGLR